MLKEYFSLEESGTTLRTEALAGVTTFATMAYIIFVQPVVLGAAGMDAGAVFTSTCLICNRNGGFGSGGEHHDG
ncbi:MAG: hypothetical protein AABN33_12535 [Acidobacteriota bacterium]